MSTPFDRFLDPAVSKDVFSYPWVTKCNTASTHTEQTKLAHSRSKNSTSVIGSSTSRTRQAQQQKQQHAAAAAAVAWRRGRSATSERASYRPVHDSRPCWLRVGVRERTRRANTKKAKVSTHYTQQKKQQQHNDYSQQQQIGPTALAEARGSDGGAAAGATSYERASLPSFA